MKYQRIIDWADDRIVEDSRIVILVFLLLTGVFAVGLGNVSTALDLTVRGTGGALLGSMLTTVFGIGVLVAVFPAIGQFGVLTGMSIAYTFLASMLILPPTLVIWDALATDNADRPSIRSLFSPWTHASSR